MTEATRQSPQHFMQIDVKKASYRFYGRGVWEMLVGSKYEPVNAIFVPAEVLHVAAENCHATPQPPEAT